MKSIKIKEEQLNKEQSIQIYNRLTVLDKNGKFKDIIQIAVPIPAS